MGWKEEDLEMLKNKLDWPLHPLLPVKRPIGGLSIPTSGVVLASDEKPTVYVGVSIFELGVAPTGTAQGNVIHYDPTPSSLPHAEIRDMLRGYQKREFSSWEEFQKEGWMVD
jgi:hypothetical protein